jgi:hypothetical protein
LLQLGVTPAVAAGYMPVTGGSFFGQISAPSILVGPPEGPQVDVITTADAATAALRGLVKQIAAIADLSQGISSPPTQAQVEAIQAKLNALLAGARAAEQLEP